jgi:hypothetical protein
MQKHGDNWFMQKYIRDLYVVVFEFFTQLFVQWSVSGWRRLVTSFDKNAFDNLFTVHQRKMNLISDKLEREARLERATRIDDMFSTIVAKNESSSDLASSQMMAMLHALGSSGQKFLEEADLETADQDNDTAMLLTSPDASSSPEGEQVGSGKQAVQYLKRDLLTAHPSIRSLLLKRDEDVNRLISRAGRAHVELRVARRLRQLLNDTDKACLWVEGPSDTTIPSQNTLTAVYVAAAAEKHKFRVISHFCALQFRQKWTAQERLILLIQSIIAQALQFVPEKFFSDRDISPEKLGTCFVTNVQASELLVMVGDVLSLIPGDVLCVVDGFQALEERSDKTHTKQLLHVFQTLCSSGRGSQSHKFLLTTDGYADGLARLASARMVDKIVSDCDSNEACDISIVSLGAKAE